MQIVLFSLLLLFSQTSIVNCYGFQLSRSITLNKFSSCPQDEKNAIRFNISIEKINIAQNLFSINGEISISEKVTGPIEVNYSPK